MPIATTTFKRLAATTTEAEYDFDNKARNILVGNLSEDDSLYIKLNVTIGADDYFEILPQQSFTFRTSELDNKLVYKSSANTVNFNVALN